MARSVKADRYSNKLALTQFCIYDQSLLSLTFYSHRCFIVSTVKNARNRARKHGAETLNAMAQALCIPLWDLVKGYKTEWRHLHPLERVMANLSACARQASSMSDVSGLWAWRMPHYRPPTYGEKHRASPRWFTSEGKDQKGRGKLKETKRIKRAIATLERINDNGRPGAQALKQGKIWKSYATDCTLNTSN